MKKLLLSLVVALPVFSFYACGVDGGNDIPSGGGASGEDFEMHDGNGPIEEPILGFYESPQSIKQQEKRHKIMDESNAAIHLLGYYGATSATAITYSFRDGELCSAGATFDAKNNDRVIDFLRSKYVPVEELSEEDRLTFETKDHFTEISALSTDKQILLTYLRTYSKEQEKSKIQEPVLAWGESLDFVKKKDLRIFNGGSAGVYEFAGGEYAGDVVYAFLEPFGLRSVTVEDIPGFYWENTMEAFGKKYKEVPTTPAFTRSFVSEELKARIEVKRITRTSFSVLYFNTSARF